MARAPPLVWHGPVDYCDSFSIVGCNLVAAMMRSGVDVRVHRVTFAGQKPVVFSEAWTGGLKFVDEIPHGATVIWMCAPWDVPGKRLPYRIIPYTMLETTSLANPTAAAIIGSPYKHLWTVSGFAAAVLRKASSQSSVSVVPHGVAPHLFRPRSDRFVSADKSRGVVFGTIGAAMPRKDFPRLIRAFRSAFKPSDRAILEIVTNSFYNRAAEPFMLDCLKNAGLDPLAIIPWRSSSFPLVLGHETVSEPTVRFVCLPPTIPHSSLAHWLGSIDVFASASHAEGFGLPGLEAMACGKIVVLPAHSGFLQYLDAGVNGLAVGSSPSKVTDESLLRQGYTNWFTVDEDSLSVKLSKAYDDCREPADFPMRVGALKTAAEYSWGRIAEVALRDLEGVSP